ncbi:MAG: hypothetical protein U1E78_11045 [Gammaproteobacteria bacterium]
MLDGAGKWFEIFKDSVKVNPFEVFTYARNIINRDRPVRSAIMILALASGMAGGAALFLTVDGVNEWAESIVLQFLPEFLLEALHGISKGLEKAFVQTIIGVFGAYIGNGVVGTTVKQLWRGLNKLIFGTTNSQYDLTAGDLDAILEKNPEYKTTEQPQHDNWQDRAKALLMKWIPMHWMPRLQHLFAEEVMPEGVRQDRENLFKKINFIRSFKKKYKRDGTKRDGAPKFALKELINGQYNGTLEDYIEQLTLKLQQKQNKAQAVLNVINPLLGDHFNSADPVNLGDHDLRFNNLLPYLKRIQANRNRFTAFVHRTGSIVNKGDLNQLRTRVQKEFDEATEQLQELAPHRIVMA